MIPFDWYDKMLLQWPLVSVRKRWYAKRRYDNVLRLRFKPGHQPVAGEREENDECFWATKLNGVEVK